MGTGAATLASQYDTVVDVVEAGADPTGEEPIDDVIARYDTEDDTLLEFPEGRYVANNLDFSNRTNYALRATGDATLVPGDDYDVDVWIGGGSLRDFRFEGFTIDNTAEGHHPTIGFSADDGLVVRDIHKLGYHDGENTAFGFGINEDSGSGYVENLEMPDGSEPETAVGVYVNTQGELTFRDCHIEGFGNNGLYASTSEGPVHVEGGTYRNNDISQIRLGSPGSSVTGASVTVDEPHPDHDNSRGIRVADGPGPVDISNCQIVMERGQGGGGVVGAYSGGGFTLRNSRIYVGSEYTVIGSGGETTSYAVYVDEPSGVADAGSVTIERVAITGGGSYHGAGIFRRGDVTIEDVCIHQTGTERDGLIFTDQSTGNSLENATIDVPGQAFAGGGAVDASGVDYEGECAMPESVGGDDDTAESSEPRRGPPLPQSLDEFTYGVMGTDSRNPTATVYGNFKCPYTREFVTGNLGVIRTEFVEPGDLNVRYRDLAYHPSDPDEPYLFDHPDNELVSQVGLGVWDVEPENYWQFLEYVFTHQDGIDWASLDSLETAMANAGVRNHGKVRFRVANDRYDAPVHDTTAAAQDLDVSFVPQMELAGDVTTPHHETESVLDWIAARL